MRNQHVTTFVQPPEPVNSTTLGCFRKQRFGMSCPGRFYGTTTITRIPEKLGVLLALANILQVSFQLVRLLLRLFSAGDNFRMLRTLTKYLVQVLLFRS